MFLWLKRLSGSMSDGQWFSGRPEVAELVLDRDWREIELILTEEGLHHRRADLEGWLAQPSSVGLIARKASQFAGFFIGHPVGHAAHVDLVCVAPGFRQGSIARPLYFRGVNALKIGGAKGLVAHARPEAGALLELLGYEPGASFTRLEHELGEVTVAGGHRGDLVDEHEMSVDEIAALDKRVFGGARTGWLQHLFYRKETEIYGYRRSGELIAALILERVGPELLEIRLAEGVEFVDISSLLHVVMVMNGGSRIRCWARVGGKLAAMLEAIDFDTPFDVIPYTEYRLGETDGVGDGPGVLQLSWW